jgi:steroid 5-alpha reductase family enzyme
MFIQNYICAAMTVGCLMLVCWLVSIKRKDVSLIDRIWGLGFVLVAWVLSLEHGLTSLGGHSLTMLAAVSIWGLRLSWHLNLRNWGQGEDLRYQKIRKKYGAKFWWQSLFLIFGVQAIAMLIVCLPIVFVMSSGHQLAINWLTFCASFLFLVGFVFEAGGDWQLKRFKAKVENRGKVLNTGLWALTRHPNYFGDAVLWFSFALFAAALPQGYWCFISPIVMTYFLRRVTGVTLLEKNLAEKSPEYVNYIESVPTFLPRPFHDFFGLIKKR